MKNETKIGNFILILLESGTLEDLKKLRENNSHLDHKQRSDTLLSVKERNIIQKITEAKEKNQKDAKKKLIWVSIVCIFFIIVEGVGGYLSGSISIWSDAARKKY